MRSAAAPRNRRPWRRAVAATRGTSLDLEELANLADEAPRALFGRATRAARGLRRADLGLSHGEQRSEPVDHLGVRREHGVEGVVIDDEEIAARLRANGGRADFAGQ